MHGEGIFVMEVDVPFESIGSWTLILMHNTSTEGFFYICYNLLEL